MTASAKLSTTFSRVVTFAVLLTVFPTTAGSAQDFGHNTIQDKNVDVQVLETEHFDIHFYAAERATADIGARLAERWYSRLSQILHHELRGRQTLVLYGSHPDLEHATRFDEAAAEGARGMTDAVLRRIVVPLGGTLADTDHVIGHELVHAFQFDMTARRNTPGASEALDLPLWFVEGMAECLSVGPADPHTETWLRDATQHDALPSIDKLDESRYFPYRWGHAFWAYVGGRWGWDIVGPMLRIAASAGTVAIAIETVLGITTEELSRDWHTMIRRTYEPVLAATTPAAVVGRLVIEGNELGRDFNVGPAISPDGRWIAFLSARSFFSIDLYVAETATGRIVRRLTSTLSDAHVSAPQFVYSAAGWDHNSRHVALAAVHSGQPVLLVFDVDSGRTERELPIPGVDAILNPTWSPDSRAIAFTGMRHGLTDLYIYDLITSRLRRLTSDQYAELQPAWSPDGRRIAFATDRFSTHLPSLTIGAYRLGLIDVDSGHIEALPAFGNTAHLNPQWSPDGSRLYFIASPDGIPNCFRLTLSNSDIVQVTNLATGLIGIAGSSPAMSVSALMGTAAFSVYENGAYSIYVFNLSRAATIERRNSGSR